MSKVKAIDVVYANWCPHCVPTTVEPMKRAGQRLGVPVRLLDIDTDDVVKADELVEKHGDWSPDYIIPQVFLEMDDGEVRHAMTGHPGAVAMTKKDAERLLESLSGS